MNQNRIGKFKYIKINSQNEFFQKYCAAQYDCCILDGNIPVGFAVTENEARFLVEWLNSVDADELEDMYQAQYRRKP